MEKSYITVFVTTCSKKEAEKIALQLLEDKLVACVNIVGPVWSYFSWAGRIDKAEEYLMLMKSNADLFYELSEKIKSLHSYDVPEVIALPVVKGSETYLEWLSSVLK